MMAFCRAFADVERPAGTAFVFQVTGHAGGVWSVVADAGGWAVFRGEEPQVAARARCDEDTAWRLFSHTTTDEIRVRLERAGFQVLSERTLPPGEVWRWSGDWVVIEARR